MAIRPPKEIPDFDDAGVFANTAVANRSRIGRRIGRLREVVNHDSRNRKLTAQPILPS